MSRPAGRRRPSSADRIDVADLVPDPTNRRLHPSRNVEMITASLQRVGAARSIVIDETNQVLAGNGVVLGAKSAGLSKVRVIDTDADTIIAVRRRGLSDEQKRALAIYDNRTAELAEWNLEQLGLDAAAALEFAPFWTDDELAALIQRTPTAGRTDPDVVPELRPTTIHRGDLFALGRHRLLCGDSTDAGDVARVMGAATADLIFTSPPYDQQRTYGGAGVGDWEMLMRGVCAQLPVNATTQVLVNLGLVHRDGEWHPYWDPWIAWMRSHGWRRFGWYVWDQGSGLPADWQGRLAPSHEFIFHFNKAPKRPTKHIAKSPHSIRDRTGDAGMRGDAPTTVPMGNGAASLQTHKVPDSVLRIQRQCGRVTPDAHHPAVFPVELPRFVLQSWPGRVFEPFAGSGSTIIAAEQLARVCHAIDIEPRYCQLTIDRWEAFTGQRAEPIQEG